MTPTVVRQEIVEGPSTDRLVDCFKYAYDRARPLYAEFTLDNGEKLFVVIEGLTHDAPSGHSHSFRGRVFRKRIARATTIPASTEVYVRGFIWTGHRRYGWIERSSEPRPLV